MCLVTLRFEWHVNWYSDRHRIPLRMLTLLMKALWSFKTTWTTDPTITLHIPENCCQNLEYHTVQLTCNGHAIHYCNTSTWSTALTKQTHWSDWLCTALTPHSHGPDGQALHLVSINAATPTYLSTSEVLPVLYYALCSKKGYGTMEVQPGAFWTLAPDQRIWTALHPGHFVSCGKSSHVPMKKRTGEPQLDALITRNISSCQKSNPPIHKSSRPYPVSIVNEISSI